MRACVKEACAATQQRWGGERTVCARQHNVLGLRDAAVHFEEPPVGVGFRAVRQHGQLRAGAYARQLVQLVVVGGDYLADVQTWAQQ